METHLWLNIWSLLEDVSHGLEKTVCFAVVGYNVLRIFLGLTDV